MGPIESLVSETVRATRLGTCYNAITREIYVNQNSFDLAKLNGAKRILFVNGRGQFELRANSSNSSEHNSTCWGASGSTSGGIFLAKVAATFKMEKANADSKSSSDIKAYVSYRYLDYYLQIQKAQESIYFNCLLPDCKLALTAVLTCTDAEERFRRYISFRNRFGTGCVTKLYLGAGSIAKVSIDTKGQSSASRSKYEGKVSVSSMFSNSEAAAGWAKEHKEAGLQGRVDIKAIDYPATSPTRAWVHALLDRFQQVGIEKITDSQEWASLPEVHFDPKNPFAEKDLPDKAAMPEEKDVDLSNDMKKTILKEEDFDGSWGEFIERQHKLMDEIDKHRVVKDAVHLQKDSKKLKSIKERYNVTQRQKAGPVPEEASVASAPLFTEDRNEWDLGDFQPVDFEVTDWEVLFPSLAKILRPPSTSNINFARLMTYYYTRLQFGEYMQFLKDVYDSLPTEFRTVYANHYLENDIPVYYEYCHDYLQKYFNRDQEHLSHEDYQYWISEFETGLLDGTADGAPEFYNSRIYSLFFENYDMLSQCPYGFICHGLSKDTEMWEADHELKLLLKIGYINDSQSAAFGKSAPYFGLQGELPWAIRLYPAILTRGNAVEDSDFRLVYFGKDKAWVPVGGYAFHLTDEYGDLYLFEIGQNDRNNAFESANLKPEEGGFVSTRVSITKNDEQIMITNLPLLRSVGFKAVTKSEVLRGSTPMFRDFPFEEVKMFP